MNDRLELFADGILPWMKRDRIICYVVIRGIICMKFFETGQGKC